MSSVASSYSAFCRSVMCEDAKFVLGSIAVFLLILMVFVGVSFTYCVLKLHPAFNFIILFVCVVLLAYVEALHYACVSVDRWNMREYADQYPRAVRCHALVDTPAKIKKFLMGRQFIVICVVFFIAQITTFPGNWSMNLDLYCAMQVLCILAFHRHSSTLCWCTRNNHADLCEDRTAWCCCFSLYRSTGKQSTDLSVRNVQSTTCMHSFFRSVKSM